MNLKKNNNTELTLQWKMTQQKSEIIPPVNTLQEGQRKPYRSKGGNICCKKVKTTLFKSQKTNKTWKKLYSTNFKTERAIYLME